MSTMQLYSKLVMPDSMSVAYDSVVGDSTELLSETIGNATVCVAEAAPRLHVRSNAIFNYVYVTHGVLLKYSAWIRKAFIGAKR